MYERNTLQKGITRTPIFTFNWGNNSKAPSNDRSGSVKPPLGLWIQRILLSEEIVKTMGWEQLWVRPLRKNLGHYISSAPGKEGRGDIAKEMPRKR